MDSDPRLLLIDLPVVEKLLADAPVRGIGDEASFAQALDRPWDLVVLNERPGFFSERGLVHRLRARWPRVPVLVVADRVESLSLIVGVFLREARETGMARLYRVLAETNQAILRARDSEELLQTVCRLAVRLGPFDLVRVSRSQDRVLAAAEAAAGPSPPHFWERHGMAGGRPVVNNDLTAGGEAGFGGWGSAAVFPLKVAGSVWGCLGFYSRTKEVFGPEESALLQGLAEDLAFGLAQRLRNDQQTETEQFLSDMANLVPGLFYKLWYHADLGLSFPYVSPGIDLILPLSPEQLQADPQRVFRALHPADRIRFFRAGVRSRDFLTVFNLEFRVLRPNGTVVWVLATAFPQKQPDGTVVWTGLAIDVSPQNRLQEALQREQELVTIVLNNIGDGVVAVDEKGDLILVNQTAARFLDGSAEAGSPWTSLDPHLPWHATDRFHPWFRRRADGTALHLEVHVSDLPAPGRGPRGRVMLLRDMTDRDRIEERLRQSEKLESIGLLAGGIAHDFNNLMTGVFGFIQLARMNAGEADRVVDYLDHALGPFQRARTLTQQLLTFAKGGEPAREPLRLTDLLPPILRFTLAGSPVSWDLEAGEVWPVLANEAQLHQVFENLFLNAKQAMPGGGAVRVGIRNVPAPGPEGRGLDAGPYVEIAVADDGPGVPSEVQSKVFDPFFTTKATGTGWAFRSVFRW